MLLRVFFVVIFISILYFIGLIQLGFKLITLREKTSQSTWRLGVPDWLGVQVVLAVLCNDGKPLILLQGCSKYCGGSPWGESGDA